MSLFTKIAMTGTLIGVVCSSLALAQDAARRQVFLFQGQYSIPIDESVPKAFAEFPVGDVKVVIKDGIPKIQYRFPKALDGIGTDLEFRGAVTPDGSWIFTDAIGELRCVPNQVSVTCKADYPGIRIDVPARAIVLQTIAGSASELQSRQQVAQIFDNEHIGVLKLTPDLDR